MIMSFTPQDEAAEVKLGLGKEWTRLKDFLKEGKLGDEEKFEGGASHDTSLLCYSSGTFSPPKKPLSSGPVLDFDSFFAHRYYGR